jgi:Spy/CpxP family protein refolding chaperone
MQPRLVAAVCILVVTIPTVVRVREGAVVERRWWRTAELQRHLHLTAAQIQALDARFERERPERLARYRQIAEMDQRLAHILVRGSADDDTVARLSEEVEGLRLQQNVRRSMMILAMYKTLTPQQRALLAQMYHARRESAR